MAKLPREAGLDSTAAFLSEGYDFISNRCQRLQTDVFETRLMLRRVICARGEDAARMFYHPDRFTRRGALPPTTLRLLQDKGSVQWLDGEAHRQRKRMFLSLLTQPAAVRSLVDVMTSEWRRDIVRWQEREQVVLHEAVRAVLCRSACRWAGVPLVDARDEARRTRELGAMIDAAGSIGPRYLRASYLRARCERWAQRIIEGIRAGKSNAPSSSAAHVIATHEDRSGERLPLEVAAVELINVLRPTVAIGRFITFAALALHEHPQCRQQLINGDESAIERFVQEVRRFYPFFPVVGGRARSSFEWRGHRFAKGDWVMLDLYGTNHDERTWTAPDTFHPDRFRDREIGAYDLVPQGAGDVATSHRCPGEDVTVALMKRALRLLVSGMQYSVPPQDLRIDLSAMPTLPASQFLIRDVGLGEART